jgi:baculoviral IAP repeat-containing protein 6
VQGTPEGDRKSNEYNAPLKEATMKFAMLEMLKKPPAGFEDVVRLHFRTNKGCPTV